MQGLWATKVQITERLKQYMIWASRHAEKPTILEIVDTMLPATFSRCWG